MSTRVFRLSSDDTCNAASCVTDKEFMHDTILPKIILVEVQYHTMRLQGECQIQLYIQ